MAIAFAEGLSRRFLGLRWRILAVAFLFVVAVVGLLFIVMLNSRFAGFDGEVLIEIPRGMSTARIANLLAGQGVIRTEWHFLAARSLRPRVLLQAGEYRFAEPGSVWEVLDRISRGDVFYRPLLVPEGSNIFEIAALVSQMGFVTASDFLAAARDPGLIRDLAPEATTLEGYLFPSTYHVTRSATAADICKLMTDQFRTVWHGLGADVNLHATVTLASLVEKETAIPEERPVIASVYLNRLRLGLRLQCDPTAVYAALLDGAYRGVIQQVDLDRKNRYNTYQSAGLPPGPIASPGLESLRATLQPANTDYIYFVAKPGSSGEHVFSASLEAHNRAVAKYRYAARRAAGQNQAR